MSNKKRNRKKKKSVWTQKHVLRAYKKKDKRTLNHAEKHFDEWFKIETFPYKKATGLLVEYCKGYFYVWFNQRTFDYNWSYRLAKNYKKQFDIWFNPDRFNWDLGSASLAEHLADRFDDWWNPIVFETSATYVLAENLFYKFDDWWDEEKLPKHMWMLEESLMEFCSHKFDVWFPFIKLTRRSHNWDSLFLHCIEHFPKWWKSNIFNWDYINHLPEFATDYFDYWWPISKTRFSIDEMALFAKDCSDHFDKWWSPRYFDWENDSNLLAKYCSEHIETWWNNKKYEWLHGSEHLAKNCYEHFELWWDADKFNWYQLEHLITGCPKHINVWYPQMRRPLLNLASELEGNFRSTYTRKKALKDLEKYCSKQKSVWIAEVMLYKLETEERKIV